MKTADPKNLLEAILRTPIRNVVGVPDSTLYPFLKQLEVDSRFDCFIATNECEAVSIAAGQYMATQTPSLVYLQNSGFGKTIHPFITLLHPEICSLPFVFLIGWRGAPDVTDEPQHKIIGQKLTDALGLLGIEYRIMQSESITEDFSWASRTAEKSRSPVALIVHPDFLEKLPGKDLQANPAKLTRSKVIQVVAEAFPTAPLVSTTGKISRELHDFRAKTQAKTEKRTGADFYTVGAMGCASSIALGVSQGLARRLQEKAGPTVVLDGDGALLMQIGTLVSIGTSGLPILHFVLDNGCHESTGGQPTLARKISLAKMAEAAGYPRTAQVKTEEELRKTIQQINSLPSKDLGPFFIHLLIETGDLAKLGRPTDTPRQSTDRFIESLRCRGK